MTRPLDDIRADIAFLKSVATDGERLSARDGATMVAVGLIFGAMGLRAWGMSSGLIGDMYAWRILHLVDAPVIFVISLVVIQVRFRGPEPGPLSRAMSAVWASVGLSLTALSVALFFVARQLDSPLVWTLFTSFLFTLYGAAWWMVYQIKRAPFIALVSMASFVLAGASGLLAGRSELWLVEAIGLFVLVALPGVIILRHSSRPA